MLPVLADLKVIRIYTFGAFLMLAFFWGSFLLWKNMRLSSYKEEDIFDGVFFSLFVGLFVSRIVYVALHFNKFGFDILKIILINGYPGLSLYGYLIGGLLALYFSYGGKKIKFIDATNYIISPLFLALGIGKLGSFFSTIDFIALFSGVLFFIGAYICNRIMFAYRRQKYSIAFNFIFFGWYFSLIQLASALLHKQQFIISLILLLTFSFYFLYYFRSSIIKKLKLPKLGNKKHGTQQKHHPNASEKTSD